MYINHFTVQKIILKRRSFQITTNLLLPGLRKQDAKKVSKNQSFIMWSSSSSLTIVYVAIHEPTIRKKLHKLYLHGSQKEMMYANSCWINHRKLNFSFFSVISLLSLYTVWMKIKYSIYLKKEKNLYIAWTYSFTCLCAEFIKFWNVLRKSSVFWFIWPRSMQWLNSDCFLRNSCCYLFIRFSFLSFYCVILFIIISLLV